MAVHVLAVLAYKAGEPATSGQLAASVNTHPVAIRRLLLALQAASLDTRIESTLVSGYFQPREEVWKEPIYRDVWGLLNEFCDAELAAKVKSAVLAEPLSALLFNVNVANGVVTLSGTADSTETRDKAARAASGVEGVKSVNNKIAVISGS